MKNTDLESTVEWLFGPRTFLVLGKWPVKVNKSPYRRHHRVSPLIINIILQEIRKYIVRKLKCSYHLKDKSYFQIFQLA